MQPLDEYGFIRPTGEEELTCAVHDPGDNPPRRSKGGSRTGQPVVPPEDLPGFPGAKRVRPKTRKFGNRRRVRWKDDDGKIYEWDSQHGTVEAYDSRGKHLGEFSPDGRRLKGPNRTRQVEP